jgi:hypothetical protein
VTFELFVRRSAANGDILATILFRSTLIKIGPARLLKSRHFWMNGDAGTTPLLATRFHVGMPLCRPMGKGMWEVRTNLPNNRTARVFICHHEGYLVALHGYIKKTRATPGEDLALARKRQKELRS